MAISTTPWSSSMRGSQTRRASVFASHLTVAGWEAHPPSPMGSEADGLAAAPGLARRTLQRFGLDEGVPAYIAAIVVLMLALLVLSGRE